MQQNPGFFSSTSLRSATLLLILYQPPTCCESLCLLSHAYPRSSAILHSNAYGMQNKKRKNKNPRARPLNQTLCQPPTFCETFPPLSLAHLRAPTLSPSVRHVRFAKVRLRVCRHVLSVAHDSRSSVLLSYVYLRAAALLRTLRKQRTFFETVLARLTCAYVLRHSCTSTINPHVL